MNRADDVSGVHVAHIEPEPMEAFLHLCLNSVSRSFAHDKVSALDRKQKVRSNTITLSDRTHYHISASFVRIKSKLSLAYLIMLLIFDKHLFRGGAQKTS